jgi:G3E family GTPase
MDRQVDWPEVRSLFLEAGTYDLRTKGEDALGWLKADQFLAGTAHHHAHTDRNRHSDDIRSQVVFVDEPVSPLMFHFFLDALKVSAGPNLLRAKGLFALSDDPDRPVVVHGVQHLIHPIDRLDRWPSSDRRTRVVMIGRNLNVDAMRSILTSTQAKTRSSVTGLVKPVLAGSLVLLGLTVGASWLAAQSTGTLPVQVPTLKNDRSSE